MDDEDSDGERTADAVEDGAVDEVAGDGAGGTARGDQDEGHATQDRGWPRAPSTSAPGNGELRQAAVSAVLAVPAAPASTITEARIP